MALKNVYQSIANHARKYFKNILNNFLILLDNTALNGILILKCILNEVKSTAISIKYGLELLNRKLYFNLYFRTI